MKYRNPIIPGFYPDPSVCRAGEDYYLVNSSFEYFPGVPVFHSRDLAHWKQIGHCLTRPSQLPLTQAPPSDGIYAPTIRHHAGKFYMATTNNVFGQGFRNFYVTAMDAAGPWSEPIWVKQGGIDPSLFFDDDGQAYWTGNGTGWAPVRGIYQSRIDIETGQLHGEPTFIWPGSGGSYPEAPHLFKRGGDYYLSVAEGGTADCHMVTIARSRDPFGPFVPCPHNPVLTHRSLMNTITSTGHADFFEDHQGRWWAVFLGIRYAESGFHNLGRETFLAPVDWTDEGWPVVNGGQKVAEQVELDRAIDPHPWPAAPIRDDFDGPKLGLQWVSLRNPVEGDRSLAERIGWLRLRCAEATLDDLASPAFIGRRQQHFGSRSVALVDFLPRSHNEEAGLAALIDNLHHAEIVLTLRDARRVALVRRRVGSLCVESDPLPVPDGPLELTLSTDRKSYVFCVPRSLERPRSRWVDTRRATSRPKSPAATPG